MWRSQIRSAIEGLRRRCGEATESLSGLSQSQMPQLREAVLSVRLPSWTEVRQRAGVHFWVSAFGLLVFAALMWFPDLIDGTSTRVLLMLLYAVIPLSALFDTSDDRAERRQFIWWNLGFVLLILGLLLIAMSDRFNWPLLGMNVLFVMISAPFLLVFAILIRGTPLTGVALVPSTIVAVVYLTIPGDSSAIRIELLLIPLPIVLIGSVVWSYVARLLLNQARKRRQVPIWGPASESLSMLFLFLPLVLFAIMMPRALTDDQIWLAASVTIIGVLLGSVVSTPLRQFLLDLGQLRPIHRWEGNTSGGQMKYTVYKNRANRYAAVHRETCSRLKVHGGVSRRTPPTGEYCEDIETAEAARRLASDTGWDVRICSYCSP